MDSFTTPNDSSLGSSPAFPTSQSLQPSALEQSIPHSLESQSPWNQHYSFEGSAGPEPKASLKSSPVDLTTRSQSDNTQNKTHADSEEFLYTCSLCRRTFSSDKKPHHLPCTLSSSLQYENHSHSSGKGCGRIFCKDCWIWIYSVAMCWTCGEIVVRGEEKVGFGWCWWHWGCLGCLVCKV